MAPKKQPTPDTKNAATGAQSAAADAVRAARQAARAAKAAAEQAKPGGQKPGMGRQADRRKNAFGIAASSSKATAVSRAIISRGRGARGR